MDTSEKTLKWCGFHRNEPTGSLWWGKDDETLDLHITGLDMNFFFQYVAPKLPDLYVSFEREGDVLYCYGKYTSGEAQCGCAEKTYFDSRVEIGGSLEEAYNFAWQEALMKLIYEEEE